MKNLFSHLSSILCHHIASYLLHFLVAAIHNNSLERVLKMVSTNLVLIRPSFSFVTSLSISKNPSKTIHVKDIKYPFLPPSEVFSNKNLNIEISGNDLANDTVATTVELTIKVMAATKSSTATMLSVVVFLSMLLKYP